MVCSPLIASRPPTDRSRCTRPFYFYFFVLLHHITVTPGPLVPPVTISSDPDQWTLLLLDHDASLPLITRTLARTFYS